MTAKDFLEVCRSKAKTNLSEGEENIIRAFGEAIEQAFTENSVERTKKLEEIASKLGGVDDGETLAGIVRGLASKVDSMEKNTMRKMSNSDKYNLKKALEAKKEDIKRAMQGGNPWSVEFSARRAAMMTNANIVTGAVALNSDNWFEDPEIVVIQYPKNFILDAISSRQVAKVPETLIVKEQSPLSGAAAVTGQSGVKPLVQFAFVKTTYNRKKYAGRIEFTEEAEIDFEQLVMQIITMFEDEVVRKWNDGILADLIAYASAYTSTGLDGTLPDPDVYSVIGAGIAWVQLNNYDPDVLVINPTDVWAMKLVQDKEGNYKYNPLGNDGFAGLQVFVTNKIAAGKLLIGTKRTVKEQHGSYIVRKGVYGDQFIENESTIVGEVFTVLQMPALSKPSWLYLDIAAMKLALINAN